ncbi:MAG TPA: hydrogenase maturation nickel metallochaperone HypA [Candidatus Limnocylindrales bacterium]
MHEFSIAQALAVQVRQHAPPGVRVCEVEVRIGPLRGVEPDALRLCWEALTLDTDLAGATLAVDVLPWSIACPACGRHWESGVPFVACPCGEQATVPSGDDVLSLVALTVDDDADTAAAERPARPARPERAVAHGR